MTKDPAVLFYTNDFIVGTLTMTDEQRGKYIMLLCLQHQKGFLTEKDMLKICGTYDFDIWDKFEETNGEFRNRRMMIESEKRTKYSESRRANRNAKINPDENKIISESYVEHMVNENINEDLLHDDYKILIEDFEIFRKNYPGTKRGYEIEFENFKKKHKDWKKIIPLLSDALDYQINCRIEKAKNGGFVPEWKNLSTWINQRCWEEEIQTTNISNDGKGKQQGVTDYELAKITAKHFGNG